MGLFCAIVKGEDRSHSIDIDLCKSRSSEYYTKPQ